MGLYGKNGPNHVLYSNQIGKSRKIEPAGSNSKFDNFLI